MQIDNFASVRLRGKTGRSQESRISAPKSRHPLSRLVFEEMRRQNASYLEVEHRSGVLLSTIKSWRQQEVTPGLFSLEAVLGSLGWTIIAVPKIENLAPDARNALEAIELYFRSDDEALGAAISVAATWPRFAKERKDELLKSPEATLRQSINGRRSIKWVAHSLEGKAQ
jgi:hypothetical protein